MNTFPESAQWLTDAAQRGDRLAAWQCVAPLLFWLSDLRNPINAAAVFQLVWSGAADKRWFDLAELIAGAAASRADTTPGLRRLHGQMLMERGFCDEALSRLVPLLNNPGLTAYDRGQVFGHIGRIYKDRFIAEANAGNEKNTRGFLQQALEAYLTGYREAPKAIWHGINAVALLARSEAQAVHVAAADESRRIAAEIIAQVKNGDPAFANRYSAATMAEASIALGDHMAAVDWVRRCVTNAAVSVFSLGNFLRQLTQLWELDRRPSPGPEIIDLLRAALLEKEGGVIQMSGNDVRRAIQLTAGNEYQAVFGADRFESLANYRRGLDRCSCVARIGRSAETGVGTGFILPGKLLCQKFGERAVMVTNAHVVSEHDYDRERKAFHPSEAVVTFAALDGVSPDKEFGLGKVLFYSPPEELDVTVAELSEAVAPKVTYPLVPVLPTRSSNAQVHVIGHPSGRGLSLSANKLLDYEVPKLHYTAATEGGSSGSPVFNQDWKLMGLHHVGGDAMPRLNGQPGTYQANEGIWIGAICKAAQDAN